MVNTLLLNSFWDADQEKNFVIVVALGEKRLASIEIPEKERKREKLDWEIAARIF